MPAVIAGLESLREDFSLEIVWLTTRLDEPRMLDQISEALGALICD